jgi:hypothetical protein
VHWRDFDDPESGIAYYEWAAGTRPGAADLVRWQRSLARDAAEAPVPAGLTDGQVRARRNKSFCLRSPRSRKTIYASVRAYNEAGLHTTAMGSGIAIDSTPPLAGFVHDGLGSLGTPVDADFQVSTSHGR